MSEKTVTRMDLAESVFREVGLSRHESAQMVESVLDHISDALVRGEQVKISSFGTFSLYCAAELLPFALSFKCSNGTRPEYFFSS